MTLSEPPHSLVLVGGGARSGKSAFALERALELGTRRSFFATAEARDSEMLRRIERHRVERGERFRTVEVPLDLPEALAAPGDCDVAIVDCLTLWVSNVMGATESDDPRSDVVDRRIDDLVAALERRSCHVVLVSNEVGMGIVPMHPAARSFRDHIGRAHGLVADMADEVVFAVVGCLLQLKPTLQLVGRNAADSELGES
ncbi:MAG: bifunctional adenosylcobinamide kinase/adenosylcobinamide-phosphate guanylyltransferase [Planctomycetota bacterium]